MNRQEQVRARIGTVNESLTRLRAERSRLLARATETERKRDTCRKIIIGGAVLAAVQHEGVPARSLRPGCRQLKPSVGSWTRS
jgi:hypothetical protein